jgi:hypothetical protein
MLEKEIGVQMRQCLLFKKVHHSVKREMLCSILNEFGIPMRLSILIKTFLN